MKREGSSSRDALLGLLTLRPMSGYDIRQLAEYSIGHFWSESYGQIYPALNQLLREGLVTRRARSGKGRPERHEYALTRHGWEAVHRWLELPARRQPPRNELLLKVFFGNHSPATIREHVRARRQASAAKLKGYRALDREISAKYGNHPGLPYWRMTLSYGISHARAEVRWCDQTLKKLEALASKSRKASAA